MSTMCMKSWHGRTLSTRAFHRPVASCLCNLFSPVKCCCVVRRGCAGQDCPRHHLPVRLPRPEHQLCQLQHSMQQQQQHQACQQAPCPRALQGPRQHSNSGNRVLPRLCHFVLRHLMPPLQLPRRLALTLEHLMIGSPVPYVAWLRFGHFASRRLSSHWVRRQHSAVLQSGGQNSTCTTAWSCFVA